MNKAIVIATFYKFVRLPDYAARQKPLLDICRAAEIKGTILLAEEGINATIAGPAGRHRRRDGIFARRAAVC